MNSNSNMGAAAPLKMEGMQYLKPDPEDAKPVRMLTDDDYEDTGELQLPPQFVPGWLTKVPQMLWEQWSDLDDDEEINLGVMREFEDNTTQLFLDPRIESHYDLPKEWEVRKLSRNVPNTYIFSEKDLPGFKGMKQRNSDHAKEKVGTTDSTGGVEKPKRYKTFYKRAVPKQTALVADANLEAVCVPVENQEYYRVMQVRATKDAAKKPKINFIDEDPERFTGILLPADREAMDFIKTAPSGIRKKGQENKASRMPRNELLDALFKCFSDYTYWSLAALKKNVNQPEAYLRETLASIADLVKSGPFNGNYKLKPESIPTNFVAQPKEEGAPEEEDGLNESPNDTPDGEDDDGDDDDLDMDDV